MIALDKWLEQYSGGETEARELAESLVEGPERVPALCDDDALCAAAKRLLDALDRFDAELERAGFGE